MVLLICSLKVKFQVHVIESKKKIILKLDYLSPNQSSHGDTREKTALFIYIQMTSNAHCSEQFCFSFI